MGKDQRKAGYGGSDEGGVVEREEAQHPDFPKEARISNLSEAIASRALVRYWPTAGHL